MTRIIGLTGGIGSGKTTIANYFKSLGFPVYIADLEAKKIMEQPEIQQQIIDEFGNQVTDTSSVSKDKLAKVVFNNPIKLAALNNIIHPRVKQHFTTWLQQHKTNPYVIKEAAILFESGSDVDCYKTITVVTPINERIRRVIVRDATTEEAVLKRINNQWTDEMRIAKSDYIIDNNDINIAKQQVDEIVKKMTIL